MENLQNKKNTYKRLRKGNPKTKIKCIAVVNVSAKRAEVTFNVTTNWDVVIVIFVVVDFIAALSVMKQIVV